jgi:hypothetical protein
MDDPSRTSLTASTMLNKSLLRPNRVPDFRSTQFLVPEWLKRDLLVLRNQAVSWTACREWLDKDARDQ